MFKIFTFKTLAVISACICFLLIAGAFFNAFSPIIEANLTLSANVPIVMYHQIKDTTSNWGNYILPTHVLKEDFEQNGLEHEYKKIRGLKSHEYKAVEK